MKDLKLKHGTLRIPVKFVPESELQKAGASLLTEGQYLFGLYQGRYPTIMINKEVGSQFSTLMHEVGEYIVNEYGLKMEHVELSVFTKVISELLQENWKVFQSCLKDRR